ncbi:hypothetical protein H0E87_013555 [Populus deltoides]|uniref:26S proteasome regulatory subunit 6B homolog n=1 Tax=Populus deltoides TaxID=3696 RepID=A0A8T2YNL2_POPDE|nr:hypothetical protein H0E87_013555 [Populus deltoides]
MDPKRKAGAIKELELARQKRAANNESKEVDPYSNLKSCQKQVEFMNIQEDHVKDDIKNLRRELVHGKEEIKRIQSVPLAVGQFINMVDENNAIVKSSTASVALHLHSHALVDVLPPQVDSRISLLSHSEKPDVIYSDIGGCDINSEARNSALGWLAIFLGLLENAPAIIFIDEVDAIATARFDAQRGADREVQRILMEILSQMDGFDQSVNVKVIMATNRADTLDPALLRPGRLDRKIEFPLPDRRQKRLIFQVCTAKMNLSDELDLEDYITRPDKISPAEIAAICQEAGMLAVRKNRFLALHPSPLSLNQRIMSTMLEFIDIQEEYVKDEQKNLKRELLRAQEEVKRIQSVPLVIGQFMEMVDQTNGIVGSTTGSNYYVRILSTIDRELLKPSASVALHRHSNALVDVLPPEADSSISLLSQSEKPDVTYNDIGGCDIQKQEILVGSEFVQKYLGEGPRMVRDVFRLAKENAPAIIFIDEVDAIATARFDAQTGADREVQRILMELLNQMDGFDQTVNVKVIMATNRADTLDPALLRPGRLDRKIEFPLPDRRQKRLVFQVCTAKMNLSDEVDMEDYVSRPDKISAAEIAAICQEAGMHAVRKNRYVILPKDFEKGYRTNVKKPDTDFEFYK